jgi:hypothetical protein
MGHDHKASYASLYVGSCGNEKKGRIRWSESLDGQVITMSTDGMMMTRMVFAWDGMEDIQKDLVVHIYCD